MAERIEKASIEVLLVLATRRGLTLSDADLAGVTAQLEGVLATVEQLNQLDVGSLEPTTYPSFEEYQR